jgi:hypothetical protein
MGFRAIGFCARPQPFRFSCVRLLALRLICQRKNHNTIPNTWPKLGRAVTPACTLAPD